MKATVSKIAALVGLPIGVLWLCGAAPQTDRNAQPLPQPRQADRFGSPTLATSGRLPAPQLHTVAPTHSRATRSAAKSAGQYRAFEDIDLTQSHKGSVAPDTAAATFSPALLARVKRLTDPFFLRPAGAAPLTTSGVRRPLSPDKNLPWSNDRLLANPTNMNDDYVSLATSPAGDVLYAAFAATDLGGTDRDIHVARSRDQGLTWQVWEVPSFSTDEYHPELAVDGGGYLHLVWIRDDGYILRSRSTNPGDPANWAWVKGLAVGEPCAVPSIAVSGAGDFAKVFIAANWLTVNYDYYQYEWTMVFMYSSNGGNTVTYDYFLPDGYPDYWPDVAMNAGTVHFVNAEQDAATGEMEILIATDAYSGSFDSPANFTGWTSSNAGYPRIACQGSDVFVVYQLDYTDGINSDGDIIYTHSQDDASSFYGPYGLVADEYDSVGPTIFVRGGVVGCLWLDAPPGGDEFQLASRLASGHGAIGYFGPVEVVTDQPRVEPVFHAAAGAIAATKVHAAWSDRRDFPTQGRNIYTSARDLKANLAPFVPDGWDNALIVNVIRGQRHDGWTAAGDTNWVSFAFLNDGLRDITGSFFIDLERDGQTIASWRLDGGLPAGTYVPVEDHPLFAPLGMHEVKVRLDATALVDEDDEADNVFGRPWDFIDGDPQLRFRPTRLVTIVNPYLKRAEALKTAESPPLQREVFLTVIDERLGAALETASVEARLPVIIVPAERLDPAALAAKLEGSSRAARREAVIAAARRQTAASLADLAPLIASLQNTKQAGATRELWLSGMIAAELTPEAVRRLAADPRVGRLWLDDVPSRTFGDRSEQGARTRDATLIATEKATAAAWHLAAIGADRAWSSGHTGQGVLIGHLDSGVAYDHPDIAGHLWDGGSAFPKHGWDSVSDDNDPYDGDTSWHHGTHTAGLIAGDGTSGTKTGVAPGAVLMPLRVVPGYFTDLVEGMQFGLDHGVQVFTMSAGWTQPPSDVRTANRTNAELLLSIDVPWITAAGNGNDAGGHFAPPNDLASPGDCPSPWYAPNGGRTAVITVGGLDAAGGVDPASSRGPTSWNLANPLGATDYHDYPYPPGLMKPDVAAPGADITSLAGASGYVSYTGTSMACPLVAGAVAILLAASPGMTPAQLAEALETTAVDITAPPAAPGRDAASGAGRIDIAAALTGVPAGGGTEFTVTNVGLLPLVFGGVWESETWLEVDQPPAFILPGATVRLTARIDPSGLLEGVHETVITFASNDPGSPHELPVTLIYGDYTTGVDPGVPAAGPAALAGYPNPFNPRTTLRFTVGTTGDVSLEIFDVSGRLVRRLVTGSMTAGDHEAVWDGLDDGGRPVGSGPYLARLRVGEAAEAVRKLTLVR